METPSSDYAPESDTGVSAPRDVFQEVPILGAVRELAFLAPETPQSRQLRIKQNFIQATGTDPEQAAVNLEIARQLGVPARAIADRPTEAKQILETRLFDPERLEAMSPGVAKYVSDPEVMEIWRDELDQIGSFENALRKTLAPIEIGTAGVARAVAAIPETAARMLPEDSPFRQAADLATTGQLTLRIPGQKPITVAAESYRGSAGVSQKIGEIQTSATQNDPYLRQVAQDVELGNRALGSALEGDASGLQELIDRPSALLNYIGLAAPSLAVTWATGGSLKAIGTLEAASQAADAADFERRTGVKIPDSEFRAVVGLTGVVNGLLERYGFDQLSNGRTGLTGILSRGLTEAGTEAGQSLFPNVLEQQTYNPEQDVTEGVLPAMIGGFGLGTTIASIDTGLQRIEKRTTESRQKVVDAQQFADQLDAVSTIAEGSQALRRDASTFRSFTADVAARAGVEDIYVDPKSLQQAGFDIPALREASPTFDSQIDEALENGTVVKIPVAEYMTDITGLGLAKSLNEHVRRTPDSFSKYEAEEFMASEGDRLREEVEQIIRSTNTDSNFETARSAVETDIFNRLSTTQQYTPAVGRAYARLTANFFAARATRRGEDIAAYYARSAPDIRAENIAQPGTYMQRTLRGAPVATDGTVELVHFSGAKGLTASDVNKWGATGVALTRGERNRVGVAPGRTYFYLDKGGKEAQLGDVAYTTRVPADRLYDLDADPMNLTAAASITAQERGMDWVSAREWLIKEAGYLGYVTTPQPGRDVVVSFENLVLQEATNEGDATASPFQTAAARLLGRRNVPGGAGVLEAPAGPNLEPLRGAPGPVTVPGRGQVAFGPFAPARAAAEAYMHRAGLVYEPPQEYAAVDPERAARIAIAFDEMEHNPDDPLVAQAYREMIDQTLAQYQAIKETGLQIEFIEGDDPYAASPRLAILDVVENNHLWVFPTDGGFGGASSLDVNISGNPLLDFTDEYINGRRLRVNDVFRIVHDYFGHIKDGNGFRAMGEENAWQSHAAMYSPLARRAMTTETRGQNSWVNYGPFATRNRTASAADTEYAPQKIGLLPEWASEDGFLGGANSGKPAEYLQDIGTSMIGGQEMQLFQGRRAAGGRTDAGNLGQGQYASPSRNVARGYGENVNPIKLTLRNPLTVVRDGNYVKNIAKAARKLGVVAEPQWSGSKQMSDAFAQEFTEKAIAAGYDGAVATLPNGDIVEVVQYQNRQDFTAEEPNVYYQLDEAGVYAGFADGGFFSKMYRFLDQKLNATGTVAQYRAQIEQFIKKGEFKAEEYEWSGLAEGLDSIEAMIERTKERTVYGLVNEKGEFEALSTAPREGYESRTITQSAKIEKGRVMDLLRSTARGTFVIEETVLTDGEQRLPTWDEDVQITQYETRAPDEDSIAAEVEYIRDEIADGNEWAKQFVDEESGEVDEDRLFEIAYDRVADMMPSRADVYLGNEIVGYLEVESEAGVWRVLDGDENEVASGEGTNGGVLAQRAEDALRQYMIDNDVVRYSSEDGNGPQFEEYTEAGAKSRYTELLIHLPNVSDRNVSQHFEQEANVLMHVRMDRRRGEGGKDVLFVEEIQSDWHQQGRQKGYSPAALRRGGLRGLNVIQAEMDAVVNELRSRPGVDYAPTNEQWAANPDLNTQFDRLIAERQATLDTVGAVADAPFKNTWPELAMKRIMLWAALSGYDQVAWTTGAMQAARYSSALQLQVGDITVGVPDAEGLIPVSVRARYSVSGGSSEFIARQVGAPLDGKGRALLNPEQLNTLFGKNVAEQIISAAGGLTSNGNGETVIEGTDLTISDKGMVQFYDKMLPSMTNKLLKRFKQEVRPINVQLGKETAVLGFDISQDMKNEILKSTGGFPLFQKADGPAPRGSYNPENNTISIFKAQNLSTFLHESGHMFLELMVRDASAPDATEADKSDIETLLKWMNVGVEDGTRLAVWNTMTMEQKRVAHEQFARGTEAYFMEGKAPSLQLRDAFRQFRAWLVKIYREAANLNVRLSPEVRQVLDRMIATDEQIKDAETVYAYESFMPATVDSGLPPEDLINYEKLGVEATQEATEALQARSLKDMKWLSGARSREIRKLQRQAAARRKEVRQEIAEQVMAEPVNQAREFLRRGVLNGEKVEGGYKLSLPELESMYADTPILATIRQQLGAGLYGMTGRENAIHPDQAAELFGFTSGDQLVRELLAAEDPQQKIDGLTDQTMLERFGDLTDERAIADAADRAVHNEARGRFVASQLNALQESLGQRRLLAAAARQFARDTVGRQTVRDLQPSRYAAAEARAAREADRALRQNNIEEAARAKRAQLIQFYSAKEAYAAQDEIEKIMRYFKKFDNKTTRKRIDADYNDQIDAILETYELRTVTNKQLDRRESLVKWLESQEALGLVPDIDPDIVSAARRKNYRSATIEELREAYESVKQIEHLGRLKNKLLAAKDAREFAVIEAELTASILDNAGGRRVDNRTRANRGVVDLFKGFVASHRKVASIAMQLDGFDRAGPFFRAFIRSMNERGEMETTMRAQATRELAKILSPLLPSVRKRNQEDRGRFGGKGVYFPTIGISLNREERIGLALNTGNAGNLQRLLDGRGWTMEQVQPVLDTLTKAEWDAVQAIWDLFEAYRPRIAAKERKLYGKEPSWVEPTPVETKFGTYRGGYYPVKYDSRENVRAKTFEAAEEAKQQMRGAFTSSTTRRSFTKERAKQVRNMPVLLTMDGLYRGVNEVIHDLAWHEWLIDANRILRSPRINRAIANSYGDQIVTQLERAVVDIARGENPNNSDLDRVLADLRAGATVAGLGFNIVNTVVNVTGLAPAVARVGPKWMGIGISRFASNPRAAVADVHGKSEMMRNRSRTMLREINEMQSVVRGQSEARQTINRLLFAPLTFTQLTVDTPIWLAAYEKQMAAQDDEALAIAVADQTVIDTQSGGQIKDLAAVQRGGAAQKLFTTFYGYFSAMYNLTAETTRKTDWKDPVDVMRAGGEYLMVLVVPAVLSTLIKLALVGTDDDWEPEQLAKTLASDQMSYLFGLMVGLREVTSAAQAAAGVSLYTQSYGGPAGLRFFQEITKLGQQINQGEADQALFKAVSNVIGILFKLPSAQINRTVLGIDALLEGDTENPLAVIAGPPKK